MTDKPVISDDEVEAFVALTKTPMGLKAALSAFLLARMPDARVGGAGTAWTKGEASGFNACREKVLQGPTLA